MRKKVTLIMAIIMMIAFTVFAASCYDSGDKPSGSASESESTIVDSGTSDESSESEKSSETVSECKHIGGTATCVKKAVCEKCGEEYGDFAAHVYGDWQHDGEKHWKECTTEGCDAKSDEGVHVGGTANCKDKAICATCGEAYGEPNGGNHASTETKFVSNGNGTHNKVYSCCDTVIEANIVCSGGEATECGAKNVCEVCGGEYGEPLAHDYATEWSSDETNHWHACTRSGCTSKNDESAHIGGEATECGKKNVCEVCDGEYGEPLAHDYATEWSSDETNHWHACTRSGCTTKNDEGKHTGGTATCIAKAVCETCNAGYGDFAAHTYGEWQYDNEKHWKECTTEGCENRSDEGSHNFNLWDKSAADYDHKACECGMIDKTQSFDKTVSLINQKISLSQPTYSIILGGVSDYVSIEKIALENYDFGTNLSALAIDDQFKADTKMHGKQTLTVIVKGDDDATHEIGVAVTFITAEITDSVEFAELQPTKENKAVYGYYVLNNDISGVSTGVAYSDWDATTGFFGTLDGQGYTITAPSNGSQGIFGILRNATIKNLTIKDNWRSGGDYTLLARGCFGITMENVSVIYGGGTATSGCGWLSNAEFSNNKLINVTIDNGSTSFSSVFGNKFRNNAFDNVVIKGTFAELGFTGTKDREGNVTLEGESVTTADDVAKIETKRVILDGRQDFILDGGVSVIDLGMYNGSKILSATTDTGFDLASLSSEYVDDVFKAAKEKHGEQNINVTLIYKGETVVVVVPVTVITKYITTMSELQAAVKHTAGASNIYGYYVLGNDVSYKEEGYTVKPATGGWSNENAFRGTLDGRGFTITINSSAETFGIFGTLNGATIKKVSIKDMYNNAGYKPIVARNAYNTTFSEVTIEIAGGAKLSGEDDNTPIIGNTMQKCALNKVIIKSSVEIVNVFANQSGNSFTDVMIEAQVTGGFSKTAAEYPDGVTVSAS